MSQRYSTELVLHKCVRNQASLAQKYSSVNFEFFPDLSVHHASRYRICKFFKCSTDSPTPLHVAFPHEHHIVYYLPPFSGLGLSRCETIRTVQSVMAVVQRLQTNPNLYCAQLIAERGARHRVEISEEYSRFYSRSYSFCMRALQNFQRRLILIIGHF